ncbi:MAG TPA: 23S rRNA (adenine(2503)-C2)-methyltransferase, partial [Promineifilum sp.]|nr:23S rRNA (adenine(2503)-C2)-methyltransferase [Promineifilum sp.]
PSSPERVARFQRVLEEYGVGSTVRVRRGIDIQAGCGQLRDRHVSSGSVGRLNQRSDKPTC